MLGCQKKSEFLLVLSITVALVTLMLPSSVQAQCTTTADQIVVGSTPCGGEGWTQTTITPPFPGAPPVTYFSPIANTGGGYNLTLTGGSLARNLIVGINTAGNNNILILNSTTAITIADLAVIAGGSVANDSLSGNRVYAGYQDQGINESDNNVTITAAGGSSSLGAAIIGASGFGAGLVRDNDVFVSSKVSAIEVVGGVSTAGEVRENSVTINGAEVVTAVYGGLSGVGIARENSVTIETGSTVNKAHGGVSTLGDAIGNSLFLKGGTTNSIQGGASESGNAIRNSVIVSGGVANATVQGGASNTGSVETNSVIISNGTVNATVQGGASGTANATGNFVTMTGGTVNADIQGGASNTGSAATNSVDISSGTVTGTISGGAVASGNATGNSVTIGGDASVTSVFGASIRIDGNATGNSVTIEGGTLTGVVFGANTGNGDATGNSVTIGGTDTLNTIAVAQLRGGVSTSGDARTGNRLTISRNVVLAAGGSSVDNFETYSFQITDAHDYTNPFLTATTIDIGSDATIDIAYLGAVAPAVGTTIPLLEATGGNIAGSVGSSTSGISGLHYDLDVTLGSVVASPTLNAVVTAVRASTGSESFPAAKLGAMAFVNQSADLISGQGIKAARMAASTQPRSWVGFTSLSGGESTYDVVGHDLNVNGISSLVGLAKSIPMGVNDITVAGFAESGWGRVDNFNKGANTADEGDSHYYGAGVLARYDFADTSGLYGEGFLRGGILESQFSSGFTGVPVNFDDTNAYYGAGVRAGYQWMVSDVGQLDLYGGYTWNHVEGSEETIAGASYELDNVNSHRSRLGVQYQHTLNEIIAPYVGAAWEYEFNGDAGGTVGGVDLKTLSLSGSTGIFLAGFKVTPDSNQPMTVDFDLTGYVGQRKGATGNVRLKFGF